jgi:hypothetical protein
MGPNSLYTFAGSYFSSPRNRKRSLPTRQVKREIDLEALLEYFTSRIYTPTKTLSKGIQTFSCREIWAYLSFAIQAMSCNSRTIGRGISANL